jgi:capsular polysaccharide biosynthesis protein
VVVIIAHDSQRVPVSGWLQAFSRDRVYVLAPVAPPEWGLEQRDATFLEGGSAAAIRTQVRRVGAVDVLITLRSGPLLPEGASDQLSLFRSLFRFVRPRGVYVFDRSCEPPGETTELRSWLDLLSIADEPDRVSLDRVDRELAMSTGTVAVTRDIVLATKRLRHFVKVRDAQVNGLLIAREPSLTVSELARLRPGDLVSRATVTSHGAEQVAEHFPEVLPYPAMYLRRYQGKVALAGRTLMYTGTSILPDSFRWHMAAQPTNPLLVAQSGEFARIPPSARPSRTLEGDYYQLDCSYPGHFGHTLTEVLSRLWGWDQAKAELPGLRVILTRPPHSWREPALEQTLFTAYGIPADDIVWVNEPVWLSSVVSASPMWHNEQPHYVHPDMEQVWRRLTAGLTKGQDDGGPGPPKIFVSRRSNMKHRDCRNAREVESVFERHGFHVVFPELHSLSEQAALFSGAEVVAGFGGSGMFNVMHSTRIRAMVVLSHEAYFARNEHLYSSLLGGDVHYVWSKPDIEQPDGGRDLEAFQSSWEFDFATNGAELEDLLGSL